jgi:DNA-binding CsgD family transcriptional regulator
MCAARIAYTVGAYERVAYFRGAVRLDIPKIAATLLPQRLTDHERIVAEAERELGESAFAAAALRGEAAGRSAVIDEARVWVEHVALTTPARRPQRIDLARRSNDGALSERQRDVLMLIASGLTNKEIAGRLGITLKTAEHHCEAIFRKLRVRGRTEATAWAHRNGVVTSWTG